MAVLDAQGLIAQAVAGHSLGEYSALVAAHAMQFEDALRVVRLRGELMRDAVRDTPGAMAAILGLSSEEVDAICREASPNGIVEGANYNAPNQVVISGEREAVDRASDLAKLRGARAVPLNVSAPFHCNLMAPVRDQLKPALEALSLVTPRVPVVANVSADYVRTAPEIRTALLAQVAAPVRWTETIHRLLDDGIQRFVEVGPGRVLSGLVRAVDRRAVTVQVGTVQDIERLLAAP
jgi:[acyl-carrier-protein] S-malonyltransferase